MKPFERFAYSVAILCLLGALFTIEGRNAELTEKAKANDGAVTKASPTDGAGGGQ